MVTNQPISPFQMTRQEERASKAVISGTGAEAVGACAGIVLSIVALVGIVPPILASVALIVLGAGIFLESAAVAANREIIERETVSSRSEEAVLKGGIGLRAIGGIAAGVLGILSLLGLVPNILLAAGVVVVGACGLLAGTEERFIGHFPAAPTEAMQQQAMGMPINDAPAALEVLGGVATIALGILALSGINPAVMTLSGLLVMSSAIFLSSAALTGRMARFLAHR